MDPEIAAHYEQDVREEDRLTLGAGLLEFLRTRELLARFLRPAPAKILDIGGGTGAYAIPLARDGFEVHLADPVARHIELAKSASDAQPDAALASISLGDACRLQWSGDKVDAVLLLGPLYHLTDSSDRAEALSHARRLLRSGGVIFVAGISRFVSTYDGLLSGHLDDHPDFEAILERDVLEGQHRNPERQAGWFTTAYFHLPDELGRELIGAGFELLGLFGVEGPGWLLPDLEERMSNKERRERLLRAIRRVESEPSVLGASAHILAVGRR
jgi:SAM-dependent methyltransferase